MKKILFICFSLVACLTIGQVNNSKAKSTKENALRLELQSFSAVCGEEKINLFWKTGIGINDACFTVEKSKDGTNFTTAIDVPCAGITDSNTDYAETDYTPYSGIAYYRLKLTYKNGGFLYSDIVSVNFASQKNIAVYPNPVVDLSNLHIAISGYDNQEVTVFLRNTQGKEIESKVLSTKDGVGVFALDNAKSLLPGVYIVTAATADKTYNYRLLVK